MKCPHEFCDKQFDRRTELTYHLFDDHKPFDVASILAFEIFNKKEIENGNVQ